jgi:hypothetical protein
VGLIAGVLLIVGVGVGFLVHNRKRRDGHKEIEEEPVDPVRQFYSDNRSEMQQDFELAFDNPVFDTMQQLVDDSGFSDDQDEQPRS